MALAQHGSKRSGDHNTNALKRIQLCCASSLIPRQLAAGYFILMNGNRVQIKRKLFEQYIDFASAV